MARRLVLRSDMLDTFHLIGQFGGAGGRCPVRRLLFNYDVKAVKMLHGLRSLNRLPIGGIFCLMVSIP